MQFSSNNSIRLFFTLFKLIIAHQEYDCQNSIEQFIGQETNNRHFRCSVNITQIGVLHRYLWNVIQSSTEGS